MMIGDDVAVLSVYDDSGAGALKLPLTRLRIRRYIEKAAEERIIQQRIALSRLLFDGAASRDVDHRRRNALDHGRKRRHRRRIDGGRCGQRGECRRHVEQGRCERGRRECETQIHAQSSCRVVPGRERNGKKGPGDLARPYLRPAILHVRARAADPLMRLRLRCVAAAPGRVLELRPPALRWWPSP